MTTHLEPPWPHLNGLHLRPAVTLPHPRGGLRDSLEACQLYEVPHVQVLQGDLKVQRDRAPSGDFPVALATSTKVKAKVAKKGTSLKYSNVTMMEGISLFPLAPSIAKKKNLLVHKPETASSLACLILEPLLPMLVINLPLFVILQHLINLVDVVEFHHGVFVVRILVRMVLHCQLSICLLDLAGRSVFANSQYLVEVSPGYEKIKKLC